MPTADDRSSIVVIKQGTYRDATKQWTNRYHFEGAVPADAAHWTTLADAIVDAEKLIYKDTSKIVGVIGNDSATATSTNPHGDAVFQKDYDVDGVATLDISDIGVPGDGCALLRYSTLARTSRNHPVYLFSYIHGVHNRGDDADKLAADQKVLIQAYGDAWVTGFDDGTGARERCGPHGAAATSARCDPFVRHRDFVN